MLVVGVSYGAVLEGLDAAVVKVEADVGRGLPQFSIVGLPDSAVSESKLRIRSAFHNAGLMFPKGKITVNLSPASLRKRGAGLDLAIAVAILRSSGEVPQADDSMLGFCGELSLSGSLVPVRGILHLALAFRKHHIHRLVIAREQQKDCLPLPDLEWYAFHSLGEVVDFLRTPYHTRLLPKLDFPEPVFQQIDEMGDFSEVVGLKEVKRALTIAAAGRHHVLLVGPPGCGKTMIAERFPSILPPLTNLEALEVYAIHQASGLQRTDSVTPPLRSPHHSLTTAGLIGGGTPLTAGEVTLAHHGVLLLDELLEFQRPTLDALREPLTTGSVRLARAGQSTVLPASFILLGTLNPCPCGQRGFGECRCLDRAVDRYWSRLSGPLLDRIDLFVHVRPAKDGQAANLRNNPLPSERILPSRQIQNQVIGARRALFDVAPEKSRPLVASVSPQRPGAALTDTASRLLQKAALLLHLSRRGLDSVTRVAQTICLLDAEPVIGSAQIEEALAYRSQTRLT